MLVPNTNHASEVSVLRLALGLSDRLVSLAPWPPPADRNLADCMADWLEERAGIREQRRQHESREAATAATWRDLLAAVERGDDPIPLGA